MWVNMWFGSSLTFSPYIFHLGFPRHQNFGICGGDLPKPKILKQGCINSRLIYFKKFISRDNGHNSRDIHNLVFSDDYGAHTALFMFEFDSQQLLLCLLLCYVLLVQLYFRFSFNSDL